MDFKEIVRIGLDECLDGLRKVLAGLTAEERRFQPSTDANHIDFIVWHTDASCGLSAPLRC